ncbi:ABC transporter ATP-binding protein [Streptococcus iniae]|uniref:ABC transporter ATP-binding protein n=1 Tax=Streptococcus iniae TaxID=1346 RepID=UPI0002DA8CFC|nr:ABC transporter ATP-binding protein [Streptococcus iniae]ESR08710.1 ABC transporter ATP-binding protein [Streptococcus iniae IUSA1]OHX26759.1 ABC transporter ATP-binding protein [Streptococcus iniae]RLV27486.1 ABC transporter ATP-binding protein [Streptococcus iniae]
MELVIRNIYKNFQEKEVLKGASYQFSSGQITGLLGRNGAGKTTLFNILYGELKADQGDIFIIDNGEPKALKNEDIGMVFSENYLPEFLTGYEFVKFYMELHPDAREKSIDDYLDFMEFTVADRHRIIKSYSDGMKSKLSLLCVLISKPKVILLDEPLTAVDLISSIAIKHLLLELRENHILILSTHMMSLAEELCDTVAVLDNGILQCLDIDYKHDQFEKRLLDVLQRNENAD